MNVDAPNRTYLVCDTSSLIQSLPLIKAVLDSHVPYTIYIPYVVLNELDRGRTAAPVNRLLCENMKKDSPRILSQNGDSHEKVFIAKGITPKNDDFIMGAALQLRDTGKNVVMVTNDNNLSMKCISNEVTCWSSLDLIYNVPVLVTPMNQFIGTEVQKLCPHPENTFRFVTVLISCALKFELRFKIAADVSKDVQIDVLMIKSIENSLGKKSSMELLQRSLAECRRKGKFVSNADLKLLTERAQVALKSFENRENTTSSLLITLQKILQGLSRTSPDRKLLTLDHEVKRVIDQRQLKNLGKPATKKNVEVAVKLPKRRLVPSRNEEKDLKPKLKSIKKKKRKRRKKLNVNVVDSDVEMGNGSSSDKITSTDSDTVESVGCLPPSTQTSSSECRTSCLHTTDSDRDVEPMQAEYEPSGKNTATGHPVHEMLDTVWKRLNFLVGSWAFHLNVDYTSNTEISLSVQCDLPKAVDLRTSIAQLEDSYNRLLKLTDVVPLELQLEIAKKLLASLNKIVTPLPVVDTKIIVDFFKNDETRELLWNGHGQLTTFLSTMRKCCQIKTEEVMKRLRSGRNKKNS